jgi:acyl-CoA hydrolase
VRCTGLHGLSFLRPVTAGQFVHVRSLVVHTSGSSITSLVSVHSEDPAERIYVENLRALFTYAPLESWVPVAAVKCHSIEERALHDEVEGRIALQRWLAAAVRGPDA